MVLTQAQTTVFFENGAQMGIPNATVVQLQTEGITDVDDLADFLTKTPFSKLPTTYEDQEEGF